MYLEDFSRFSNREIIFDDNLRCKVSTEPIKILGLTYDSMFNFKPHLDEVLKECNGVMNFLYAIHKQIPAEKMKVLYTSLVLSRLLYGIDAYYPYLDEGDKDRLNRFHYNGCRMILGCPKSSHTESVLCEAGFPSFEQIARNEIIKMAGKLAHLKLTVPGRDKLSVNSDNIILTWEETQFGMDWLINLYRNNRMPTAVLRPQLKADGSGVILPVQDKVFPKPTQTDRREPPETINSENPIRNEISLRDARYNYFWKNSFEKRLITLPHPLPPEDLSFLEENLKIISSPPLGLKKPDTPPEKLPQEIRDQFRAANEARMKEIEQLTEGMNVIYCYVDAARKERNYGRVKVTECIGYFTFCSGRDPTEENCQGFGEVLAGPFACIYTGETNTLIEATRCAKSYIRTYCPVTWDRSKKLAVVYVTDSQSALAALDKTWIRKMNLGEQKILFNTLEVAKQNVLSIFAFVFSHFGLPGNEYVDRKANHRILDGFGIRENEELGLPFHDSVRHAVSKSNELYLHLLKRKCVLKEQEEYQQEQEQQPESVDSRKFRFRNFCLEETSLIKLNVVRGALTREQEILLFNARLGMIPQIGGYFQGTPDPCPFCHQEGALTRNGKTLEHLFQHCDAEQVRTLRDDFVSACSQQQVNNKNQNTSTFSFLFTHPLFSAKFLENLILLKNTLSNG